MGQTATSKQIPGSSTPPKPYTNGSLPSNVKRFFEVSPTTSSYEQRTHPPRSLINTYMVVTFLEEASQSSQSLKRNAGIRDLAQRLHLWRGDIASQLQKDAVEAVELLDKYVTDSLGNEMKYVSRIATKEFDGPEAEETKRVKKMAPTKEDVIADLDSLKYGLLAQVKGQMAADYDADYGSLELHDLAPPPFIPGFTSTRSNENNSDREASQYDDILGDEQLLSPLKKAALSAIDTYLEKAKIAMEFRKNIVEDDSLDVLRGSLDRMLEIQDAFEKMGDEIFETLKNRDEVHDWINEID